MIVLGPGEFEPIIIQRRIWDPGNNTLREKLENRDEDGDFVYPRHKITDEECEAILEVIRTTPINRAEEENA